jgi:predicted small secreted protein
MGVSRMKKLALLLAFAALSLAGCNTVAGVGEDITGGARLVGDAIGG